MTEDDYALAILKLATLSIKETENDLLNALVALINALETSAIDTQKKRDLNARELIAYRQAQIALDMFLNSAYIIDAYSDNFLERRRRIVSEIQKREEQSGSTILH